MKSDITYLVRHPWNNPHCPAPPRTNICPYCRCEAAPGPVCKCPEQQHILTNRTAEQARLHVLVQVGVGTAVAFQSKTEGR